MVKTICDFCKQKRTLKRCNSNLISNKIFELCKECIKLKDTQAFFYNFCEAD